jgi:nicotinate-nucleotide--dimethylbenzimidazole phosphoribosyltransferase
MGLLDETLAKITAPDPEVAREAGARWDRLYMGMAKLGHMRDLLVRYAEATGEAQPAKARKIMIIACADHGISEHHVSAYPARTTADMVRNYLVDKGAAANAMAALGHIVDMEVVNMGVRGDLSHIPGLIHRSLGQGTADITQGPAMTREQAIRSLETGIELVEEKIDQGYRVFLPGEMGISNTASSAAIIGALNQWNASEVTGRGSQVSNETYGRKVELVQQALDVNRPDSRDAIDVLAKVGGFEIGCMAGMILGAAARRGLAILDGFNASAAMQIAKALNENTIHSVFASNETTEKGHKKSLESLGLHAPFHLHMAMGEAAGAVMGAMLLDTAVEIQQECASREALGIGDNE